MNQVKVKIIVSVGFILLVVFSFMIYLLSNSADIRVNLNSAENVLAIGKKAIENNDINTAIFRCAEGFIHLPSNLDDSITLDDSETAIRLIGWESDPVKKSELAYLQCRKLEREISHYKNKISKK